MPQLIDPIRKPVKREGAERYLLYTLLSFAASVALTRLFLELTGYPQLGNSELHIAHVLWGGLLLFVASLLPLIFANRWVYTIGALGAGIGVGLFIDEVGKFITQSNDYFYPAAAPIIYAFFLLTVLVYFQVRRPPKRDARSELYRALDAIEEILDRDLDAVERLKLKARLKFVQKDAPQNELADLAESLLTFINSEALTHTPVEPTPWKRLQHGFWRFEERWFSQERWRIILAGGLLALSLVSLAELAQYLWALRQPAELQSQVNNFVAAAQINSASGLGWFYARLALEVIASLLMLIAAILLLRKKDQPGTQLGSMA
ncbi:MAG TPA: hypothetical protein DEH22_10505, partial [Chloroflexi bacterium]|nr:hypothetical protein [Chloroflexota bacterium]